LSVVAAVYDRRYFVDSRKTDAHRAPLQLLDPKVSWIERSQEWYVNALTGATRKADLVANTKPVSRYTFCNLLID